MLKRDTYPMSTEPDKHLTQTRFDQLGLPEPLLKGLQDAGLEYCTPIQEMTLPLTLDGKDVSGQAQTGTGKTISFLLALFSRLMKTPAEGKVRLRALVIAPTRELAYQIYADATMLNKHLDFKIGLAYGGKDYQLQREIIEAGIDVLIGTPGRIIDYYKQKVFSLDDIEVMVLDEADRMFDLGFITDIRFVFRRLPDVDKRLSMLFSATFTYRVHELAYEHMNNPQTVKIESENITADKIQETVYYPAMDEKIPLLISLLPDIENMRVLVFVNTKHVGDRLYRTLKANGFKAGILSGDVHQSKREKLLQAFKSGQLNVLVGTDVAARGLHIDDVSHVINYDLPQDAEDYVHRVGRTARAGATGIAISFACEQSAVSLPDIEDYIGHPLPSMAIAYDSLQRYKRPAPGEERPKRRSRQNDKPRRERSRPDRPRRSEPAAAKPERPRQVAESKPAVQEQPAQVAQPETVEQSKPARPQPERKPPTQQPQIPPVNERVSSKRGNEIPAIG